LDQIGLNSTKSPLKKIKKFGLARGMNRFKIAVAIAVFFDSLLGLSGAAGEGKRPENPALV
jgi:hypothetical protein